MSGVVAVVVTYRRIPELRRLVGCLEATGPELLGCVVVDHEGRGEVREALAGSRLDLRVVEDGTNPGPGAGWANGARTALREFGPGVEAIWYLDDDVVIGPDCLASLLKELQKCGGGAMAPLLSDAGGKLWAFPEPREEALRKLIRKAATPAEALRLLGGVPLEFCWATGACLLVSSGLIGEVGFHRDDFWMLGEDLEYSMRIAVKRAGFFTCRVEVQHLPPAAADAKAAMDSDYRKFLSLLQNLSYLAFHVSGRGHMWRYLPGNFRRFIRVHGKRRGALGDGLVCFWRGAVLGRPAGSPSLTMGTGNGSL
jgi:GT2 family glycosyltransferase